MAKATADSTLEIIRDNTLQYILHFIKQWYGS